MKLAEILSRANLPGYLWQLPDASYETVSADWVIENWRAWLDARPIELCVCRDVGGKSVRERPLWIADVSDCDNLALGLTTHGHVGNATFARRIGQPRGGLAFGCLHYTASPARPANFNIEGGHAINWFVDHEGNVRFFEPGVGQLVDLNAKERGDAWFGYAA